LRERSCGVSRVGENAGRPVAVNCAAVAGAFAVTAGIGTWSVSGEITVGACGTSTQMQIVAGQFDGGACVLGQHGCVGDFVTGIEAQSPIGFRRRKATARIAKPNLVVVGMLPFAVPARTFATTILTP
jgi:hypothetical protein